MVLLYINRTVMKTQASRQNFMLDFNEGFFGTNHADLMSNYVPAVTVIKQDSW